MKELTELTVNNCCKTLGIFSYCVANYPKTRTFL
jgi:hypothetical protein